MTSNYKATSDKLTEQEEFLISPYCGELTDLSAVGEETEVMIARASRLPRIQLTPGNLCDLEILASGGFSPLDRYMGRDDYRRALEPGSYSGYGQTIAGRECATDSAPSCRKGIRPPVGCELIAEPRQTKPLKQFLSKKMVGACGFEPHTPTVSR
jgi:PUA-like domain